MKGGHGRPPLAGVSAYNALVPTVVIPRSHAQVSALFAGLPLVPPGVVPSQNGGPPLAGRPMPPICVQAWLTLLPPGP